MIEYMYVIRNKNKISVKILITDKFLDKTTYCYLEIKKNIQFVLFVVYPYVLYIPMAAILVGWWVYHEFHTSIGLSWLGGFR